MQKPILSEDGTFIPRTRLGRFLHFFATVVGLTGIASGNWDLFVLGGVICMGFDVMRSTENLILNREISSRVWVYLSAIVLGTPFFGFLRSSLLAPLIVGTILTIIIPILFLGPRRELGRDNTKRRATQVVTRRDMTNQADQ